MATRLRVQPLRCYRDPRSAAKSDGAGTWPRNWKAMALGSSTTLAHRTEP